MAKVRLTDKYVSSLKVPANERLEVFDQDVRGLILRASAQTKAWVFRYRGPDGKQRRYAMGIYLDGMAGDDDHSGDAKKRVLNLAQARAEARDLINQVARGQDPATVRDERIAKAKAQTIKTLDDLQAAYFLACEIGEYRPRKKRKRLSTLEEEKGVWRRHIQKPLGGLTLDNVTPTAIKNVLRALVAKGHGTTSNRVRSLIRQLFNFAIHEELLEVNPINKVKAMAEEKARQRILTDDELRAIWAVLNDPTGYVVPATASAPEKDLLVSPGVRIAIKLLVLLLARRAEVAGMVTSELDLVQAGWTIPGERTKNGRSHFIPLPHEAVSLIKEALEQGDTDAARNNSRAVFPSPRGDSKSITPGAITHALRDIKLALGLENLRPHDLRRTAATILGSERLRVPPYLVSRLLNHTTETGGAAKVTSEVYMLYEYAPEKRAALAGWANLLLEIVGERKPQENVVTLSRA